MEPSFRPRFIHLLLSIALAIAGCGSSDGGSGNGNESSAGAPAAAPAAAANPQARAEAESVFNTRCTPCHGASGAGDGPASASLDPRPRNFRDGAWQESVTDEHISRIIQYGGAAVGRSPAMPANPDLQPKTEVVAALVAHVRSLAN